MIKKLSDIFKQACQEDEGTVTLPIRIKNGKIIKDDEGLFELLSFAGECDNLFTIVEITDTNIKIEISHEGVCNIVKEIIKLER